MPEGINTPHSRQVAYAYCTMLQQWVQSTEAIANLEDSESQLSSLLQLQTTLHLVYQANNPVKSELQTIL